MSFLHILLAVSVAFVWGINFIFVKLGLHEIPPLLLCTLRFMLASLPVIFFVERPRVAFTLILQYGIIMFALQFSLLFIGMKIGMSCGMASLILQSQVFFTILFSVLFFDDRAHIWQIIGALLAFLGICLVGFHLDNHITLWGFLCVLASAACMGYGNLLVKKMQVANRMSLVIWGSFIACWPMAAVTLIFEGPKSIVHCCHQVTWIGMVSLLYITFASTWIGYGVWNWLIGRHPLVKIAPFTLLVPMVGMMAAVLLLDEPMEPWKLMAGLLIVSGLGIHLFGQRIAKHPLFSSRLGLKGEL